jgi:hypothetical protein
LQDHDQTAPSRPSDGTLKNSIPEGFYIAQLIPGLDNTILFIVIALVIIIIPAVLYVKKARDVRASEEGRARRQRLDYQPSVKPIPVTAPSQVSRPARKPQPVAAPVPGVDLLENCQDLQQSLCALAGKYSLDSFTIATSDGLVFASSGSSTAQEDAAGFCRNSDGTEPKGVILFSMNHKGSELTGIIRSEGIITEKTKKGIENDTKDILNRWI